MIGPKEKKERRIGSRLHLKGVRCNSSKCALVRKPYPPGVHGPNASRKSISDYGQQLKEKQKVKLLYGLREKALNRLLEKALQDPTSTVERLAEALERRLDNIVYSLGFTSSKLMARQIVLHGHVLVNGKKVTSPSFQAKKGDVISLKPSSLGKTIFKDLALKLQKYQTPEWLKLDYQKIEGRVESLPKNIQALELNMLVELYSK